MSGLAEKRPITLPNRRVSRGERLVVEGRTLFIHCGFDVDGTVREIFVTSKQATSELLQMLTDQAMGISYRLQYGPRLSDMQPRSTVMRKVVDQAIIIEREEAAAVIAEYQRYVVPTVMAGT
jgi:hypothetical protein